jgi:hypothetical protein
MTLPPMATRGRRRLQLGLEIQDGGRRRQLHRGLREDRQRQGWRLRATAWP